MHCGWGWRVWTCHPSFLIQCCTHLMCIGPFSDAVKISLSQSFTVLHCSAWHSFDDKNWVVLHLLRSLDFKWLFCFLLSFLMGTGIPGPGDRLCDQACQTPPCCFEATLLTFQEGNLGTRNCLCCQRKHSAHTNFYNSHVTVIPRMFVTGDLRNRTSCWCLRRELGFRHSYLYQSPNAAVCRCLYPTL